MSVIYEINFLELACCVSWLFALAGNKQPLSKGTGSAGNMKCTTAQYVNVMRD